MINAWLLLAMAVALQALPWDGESRRAWAVATLAALAVGVGLGATMPPALVYLPPLLAAVTLGLGWPAARLQRSRPPWELPLTLALPAVAMLLAYGAGTLAPAAEPLPAHLALLLLNADPANRVVRALLEHHRLPRAEREPTLQAGRLIGTLERWIVLELVFLGELSAVGLVIAAKSVTRFKQLEDRTFAEYYLIGTLASFVLGGASGLALRALLGSLGARP